jgi:hypothetical protein
VRRTGAIDIPTGEFIRVPNPDAPVFRIEKIGNYRRTLSAPALYLAAPWTWDDPLEDPLSHVSFDDAGALASRLPLAFGQCWSATAESDTLWRAYSRVSMPGSKHPSGPAEEGVQLRSTPRKLLAALATWTARTPGASAFVGSVEYRSSEDVDNRVHQMLADKPASPIDAPLVRAESLLFKRLAFQHEAEVRLVCVAPGLDRRTEGISVPVDPNALFDEVAFDPRLDPAVAQEREAECRTLGYTGPIGFSRLYRRLYYMVMTASI